MLMPIRYLPLLAGLLPILAINGSYLIAWHAELVPACFPYVDGCTSISSTGRHPPASFLFKGAMLPQSVVLFAFWLVSVAWLRALERSAGLAGRSGTLVGLLGTGGAVFLILYVSFLGSDVPFYEFMRRFGVYLYFALTVFAQLGLAYKARRCAMLLRDDGLRRLTELQLLLGSVPFVLGALNLVLKAVLSDARTAENIIEWLFALLMQLFFLVAWATWRHSGFNARFNVAPHQKS